MTSDDRRLLTLVSAALPLVARLGLGVGGLTGVAVLLFARLDSLMDLLDFSSIILKASDKFELLF